MIFLLFLILIKLHIFKQLKKTVFHLSRYFLSEISQQLSTKKITQARPENLCYGYKNTHNYLNQNTRLLENKTPN